MAAQVRDAAQHATGRRPARPARRRSASARRRRAGRRPRRTARSGPGDGQPVGVRLDRAAHRGQDLAGSRHPAGWCPAASRGTVTAPPVTAAAARNGVAFDRSGSTAQSRGRDRARLDPPGVRARLSSTVDAGLAQHRHGHVDVRQRRAPACRRGGRSRPCRSGRRTSSRPETNCDDADASIVTVAAGQAALAVQGERQRVAVDARRRARAGRPARCPSGRSRALRVAVEVDLAVGERGGGRHEPHDGAREPAVDVRRAAQAGVRADRDAARRRRRRARRAPRSAAIISAVSRLRSAPVRRAAAARSARPAAAPGS